MNRNESIGSVALVGAGPGDPGLLTVRGRELLESAQTVVYDALSNPQLLHHCPQARQIYVGKKAAAHLMSQEKINDLLVQEARAGQRVVRLKGGDPFVFGRGGEECEALAKAGVPFEVVPGVTAAIGAAAYAGIPITHRDLNSSFTFITGHEKEADYQDSQARNRAPAAGSSDIDWSIIAKLPCIAFYMGVKSLGRICQRLIDHGMDPATPAATIRWGTMPIQRTITGTVANLPDRVAEAKIAPPALTVIGRTVELRPTLNWFESRPLFGQTVIVTRTTRQAGELSVRLARQGANVIEAPTIELVKPSDWTEIDTALDQAGKFDWIIFTSSNGVAATRRRLLQTHRDVRAFGAAKLATIGSATAAAVNDQLCLRVDLSPERFMAEALAEALGERNQISGKRFLLLRADIARPVLGERLRQGGAAEVRDIPIYQTQPATALPQPAVQALNSEEIRQRGWITFTSAATAANFVQLLDPDAIQHLQSIRLASIGPITTGALKELGLTPAVEAPQANLDALVKAMCGH